jgi:hypothetical protein
MRAVGLVTAMAAFVFSPVPLCPVRVLLRQPCPGCGVTRACFCALHGDFGASFRMHPLALVAAALVLPSAFFVLRDVVRTGAPRPLPRVLRGGWTALYVALVLVWIARFFGFFGGPVPV